MNILRLLLFCALISVPAAVDAQRYLPGNGVTEDNPQPVKTMCWSGTAWTRCPTSGGGGASVPTGTAGAPTSQVLTVQGAAGTTPIPVTLPSTPIQTNIANGPIEVTLPNTTIQANITNTSIPVTLPSGPLQTNIVNTSLPTTITNASPLSVTFTNTSISTSVNAALPTGTNTIGRVLPARDATPVAAAGYAVSTAVEAGRVLKNAAGNLFGLNVMSGGTAGYVMLFNSATIPADGAVAPVKCYALAPNSSLDLNYRATPTYFATGITVVFSTTGCFTKTGSATAYFSGDVK